MTKGQQMNQAICPIEDCENPAESEGLCADCLDSEITNYENQFESQYYRD